MDRWHFHREGPARQELGSAEPPLHVASRISAFVALQLVADRPHAECVLHGIRVNPKGAAREKVAMVAQVDGGPVLVARFEHEQADLRRGKAVLPATRRKELLPGPIKSFELRAQAGLVVEPRDEVELEHTSQIRLPTESWVASRNELFDAYLGSVAADLGGRLENPNDKVLETAGPLCWPKGAGHQCQLGLGETAPALVALKRRLTVLGLAGGVEMCTPALHETTARLVSNNPLGLGDARVPHLSAVGKWRS